MTDSPTSQVMSHSKRFSDNGSSITTQSTTATTNPTPNIPTKPQIPHRQIRATFDETTITVYQAYSSQIANPAVQHQNLSASPHYLASRMTWIKPSWNWMMYRCGYSYKDARQERVLALKIRHGDFVELLAGAVLSDEVAGPRQKIGERAMITKTTKVTKGIDEFGEKTARRKEIGNDTDDKNNGVRVQWDPERGPKLERLDYRSIQIGIPGRLKDKWIDEMIVAIEDVTERARALKKAIDENPDVTEKDLKSLGLLPDEKVFDEYVHVEVRRRIRMDVNE